MRDFPIFTTQYGVASIYLKEVPYRGIAYVVLRESLEPEKLLDECVSFCRVCGAEDIFASGHKYLEARPHHTTVYEMRGEAWYDQHKVENLFPVTELTVGKWRQIYNERMADVDNAATQEQKDEKDILSSGGAYFVHRSGELLGIGWFKGNELAAVATVKRGAGERVMHTLMSLLPGQQITLEVASTNTKALNLYERLGFLKMSEISKWYCV